MLARIYKPARNAMQSGKGKTQRWTLSYEPEAPLAVEPLMGYTASVDMRRQINLTFETREEAVGYAERNGIPYQVFEPEESKPKLASYSDNFKFGRPVPWTH